MTLIDRSMFPGEPGQSDGGGIFGGLFGGANMPAIALAASAVFKTFGQIGSANALVTRASRQKQAAGFTAEQLRLNAGQVQASTQRDAYFAGLEADLLASKFLTQAGASGTAVNSPGFLALQAEITSRDAYRRQAILYGGKDKARTMEMQAKSTLYQADLEMADAKEGRRAGLFAAGATALAGAGSLYRYWPKDKVGTSMSRSMIGSQEYELDAGQMWRD